MRVKWQLTFELLTTSRPEAVYLALRQSIVSTVDAPGSVLTEATVADRYAVARPTAKAAIERLVSEGLLVRTAHRTARVPILDEPDIRDLYASRVVIEEAGLRNLALTGTVPRDAKQAHRDLTAAAAEGEEATFARADIAFHRALVLGQSSIRLARMHALIMGEIELCIGQVDSRRLLSATIVAAQHQGILDAVIAADVELAGTRTREHILTSRDRLLSSLTNANVLGTS
jgi:DNA-binding GntR family transcriptional regulator